MRWWWLAVLGACGGPPTFIVEGSVVEVRSPSEVVLDHEEVAGLMGPMVMPFQLADAGLSSGLKAGDRVVGRLVRRGETYLIEKVRVTGTDPRYEPGLVADAPPMPLRPTERLPPFDVPVTGGETWRVGAGQGVPTLLTFVYSTCPLPEFCPATILRLQQLQRAVEGEVRIVAVTIDPARDTLEVLQRWREQVGADARWQMGRLEGEAWKQLLGRAALYAAPGSDDKVEHNTRLLVLDREGRLIERYDDNRFPLERVVEQLKTGGPPAPQGSDGTVTPREPAP